MTTTRTLVIEKEPPHPVEKIWRALTQGALIKDWLMDNDFQSVVGHRFNFRSTPMPKWDGVIDCEVLAVEPNTKLSYSWNALGLESVVVWTLTATSSGTLVRMEQSGFGADQDAAYQGATYGWQKFIGNLERVVVRLAAWYPQTETHGLLSLRRAQRRSDLVRIEAGTARASLERDCFVAPLLAMTANRVIRASSIPDTRAGWQTGELERS